MRCVQNIFLIFVEEGCGIRHISRILVLLFFQIFHLRIIYVSYTEYVNFCAFWVFGVFTLYFEISYIEF